MSQTFLLFCLKVLWKCSANNLDFLAASSRWGTWFSEEYFGLFTILVSLLTLQRKKVKRKKSRGDKKSSAVETSPEALAETWKVVEEELKAVGLQVSMKICLKEQQFFVRGHWAGVFHRRICPSEFLQSLPSLDLATLNTTPCVCYAAFSIFNWRHCTFWCHIWNSAWGAADWSHASGAGRAAGPSGSGGSGAATSCQVSGASVPSVPHTYVTCLVARGIQHLLVTGRFGQRGTYLVRRMWNLKKNWSSWSRSYTQACRVRFQTGAVRLPNSVAHFTSLHINFSISIDKRCEWEQSSHLIASHILAASLCCGAGQIKLMH